MFEIFIRVAKRCYQESQNKLVFELCATGNSVKYQFSRRIIQQTKKKREERRPKKDDRKAIYYQSVEMEMIPLTVSRPHPACDRAGRNREKMRVFNKFLCFSFSLRNLLASRRRMLFWLEWRVVWVFHFVFSAYFSRDCTWNTKRPDSVTNFQVECCFFAYG